MLHLRNTGRKLPLPLTMPYSSHLLAVNVPRGSFQLKGGVRKRSGFLSGAFSRLAYIVGFLAVPAVGHSTTLQIINWVPPLSGTLSMATPGEFVTNTKNPTHTVPMWGATDNGYSFSMVGTDPTVKGSTAVTSIATKIIPLRFSASSTSVFDPENADACSPKRTPAINMVQQSPVFKPVKLTAPLDSLGTYQLPGLYQRANFWVPFIQPKGINSNYQIAFNQVLTNRFDSTKYTIEIGSTLSTNLPYAIPGQVQTDPTWCNQVAMIEVNAFDSLLQTVIIPSLKNDNVVPDTLPIFLLSNVVLYDTNTANCCILGYHNAYLSAITTGTYANRLQTYIVANYNSTTFGNFTGAFPTAPDIVALSNMIAGWMDNPTTLNPTPQWPGIINGMSGCQGLLEVAYPPGLSGAPTSVTAADKIVYHVQDLAFKGWFYGDGVTLGASANSGFGGNYSLFHTFGTPNLSCP
jgi:hypothetical protein